MKTDRKRRPTAVLISEALIFGGLGIATAVLLGVFEPSQVCSFESSPISKGAYLVAGVLSASGLGGLMYCRRKVTAALRSTG